MTNAAPPPPPLSEEEAARDVLRIIEARGHTALIVGGAVRDHVLGLPMHDVDLATDMPPERLCAVFRAHDVGKSKDFGVFVVLHAGWSFEVARFRGETRFDDQGRRAGLGSSATFAEDARRRDFTVNALGLDLRGTLHDPWGGLEDLRRRLLRGVENPGARFDEDPVRLLRAVRFAARFGFALDPATEEALRARVASLEAAAPERLGDELVKMAAGPGALFADAVRWLDRVGLLEHLLPEVSALKGLAQDACWHPEGDVFEHTLAACRASRVQDPLVHLAVLLHDVGKALAYVKREGKHTYWGHEDLGVAGAAAVADRLRFSATWRDALCFVVSHHMLVPRLATLKPSKVFRLVNHPHWSVLKEAAFCDQAGRGDSTRGDALLALTAHAEQTARTWQHKGARPTAHNTVVSGHRLMELTGLPPGPAVGRLLREVTDWAIDNSVTEPDEIETQLVSLFRNRNETGRTADGGPNGSSA